MINTGPDSRIRFTLATLHLVEEYDYLTVGTLWFHIFGELLISTYRFMMVWKSAIQYF